MCTYRTPASCIRDCGLRSTLLLFYTIISLSTALKCYVSGPVPNNGIVDIPFEECHPTAVACMKTISRANNFSSFYCSIRKCTTETEEIDDMSPFYNTANYDSEKNYCCYRDGCNAYSTSRSLKPNSFLFLAITIIFTCIKS